VYGAGHSEKIISKVLKGRRQEVFLATKFAVDRSGSTMRINGSPEYLTKACDASLERLGTDYIDLYYCHRIDPTVYVFTDIVASQPSPIYAYKSRFFSQIEDTVGAMAKLVEKGKVRYLGLSECSADTLRRAYKVHPIAAVQVEYR
jgi:aryl-alcohol dehydrogenase-like predicted oxidoreductase